MFFSQYPYYVIYSFFLKSFLSEGSLDVSFSHASKFKSLAEAKEAANNPFYNSFGDDYVIYRVESESNLIEVYSN